MATKTVNVTMSLASDWAWSQVRSKGLDFSADTTPIALVFLGYARLADEALDSPSGYNFTTFTEMAELIGLESYLAAIEVSEKLARCGLLVSVEGGYRIPEEAFQVPMTCGTCGREIEPTPVTVGRQSFYRHADGTGSGVGGHASEWCETPDGYVKVNP